METGINIGVSKETVQELGKVILDILYSKQDQATIQLALTTLEKGTKVTDTSITNCTIKG